MEIIGYLRRAVEDQASDIFIIAGGPLSEKLDGHMRPIGEERLLPPKTKELVTQIYALAERPMDDYLAEGDDDFAFAIPGLARFRVNAYRQRGSLAAVVRIVSFNIPDWEKIHIPQRVMDLASMTGGIILMTGTAGSGKSTTQACIIDRIIDSFPAAQQSPIRTMLSLGLKTVVSQRMVPDVNGGMVPVFEVMHVNSAIRGMIRDNKNHQIASAIAAGSREGMITMDQALLELYREGLITAETVLENADAADLLRRQLT